MHSFVLDTHRRTIGRTIRVGGRGEEGKGGGGREVGVVEEVLAAVVGVEPREGGEGIAATPGGGGGCGQGAATEYATSTC